MHSSWAARQLVSAQEAKRRPQASLDLYHLPFDSGASREALRAISQIAASSAAEIPTARKEVYLRASPPTCGTAKPPAVPTGARVNPLCEDNRVEIASTASCWNCMPNVDCARTS